MILREVGLTGGGGHSPPPPSRPSAGAPHPLGEETGGSSVRRVGEPLPDEGDQVWRLRQWGSGSCG